MSEASQHFYCGNYSSTLKLLGKTPLFKSKNSSDWPHQIGSLVFTGELLEALTLFQLAVQYKKLPPHEFAEARFYIGVGLVRTSRYDEAIKYFARNLNEYRKLRKKRPYSSRDAFFAYQGAAFFKFFQGHFRASRKLAEKSFQAAFESNFLFGLAFSSELMGHCNCQLGEVHKGLKDFDKAVKFAQELGNGGLCSAFQIAKEKFKAQYGTDIKNTEKNLYKALRTLKPEDTYSKAELYLELSRQLVLRGKTSKAKELLDENAETVYKHQNRRQSATFNLRYAHILFLQGESHAALTLLRSSKGNLVRKVDKFYLNQLQGLEEKILSAVSLDKNHFNIKRKFLSFVDERIYSRRSNNEHKISLNTKQDPIGDFLDSSHDLKADLSDLDKNGLLGLIPHVLKQKEFSSFILLGPHRGQVIIYSKGDAHWINEGITLPMKKILSLLEGGTPLSKEKIIQNVWGYDYRPDRHDNLLQATIAKLRKHMGPFAHWIEWHSSGGYNLKNNVVVLKTFVDPAANSQSLILTHHKSETNNEKSNSVLQASDLNHRQITLIKKLKDGSFVGVSDYSKLFKVCKMTACRDLTSLLNRNILKKYGRARATQYCLRGIENETSI